MLLEGDVRVGVGDALVMVGCCCFGGFTDGGG